MAWVWRRCLLAWEENSVRECTLLLHNVVLQVNVSDKWRWLLDHVHGYTIREAYRFITSGEQVDRSLVYDVWHWYIPANVSLFVWRLLRNRLPTRDNFMRWRIIHGNDTVFCFWVRRIGISNSPLFRVWDSQQCLVIGSKMGRLIYGVSLSAATTFLSVLIYGWNAA